MKYPSPLISAILVKRYKRFLADVKLATGKITTVHCPNSGSMLGCQDPGSKVLISDSKNPNRKLRYTWELLKVGKSWVCVNTMRPNEIVYEAISSKKIPGLKSFDEIKREVKYGTSSRVDIWLKKGGRETFVEVKNVTLRDGCSKRALFPDAVTTRGKKHLEELSREVQKGNRAVMFYLLNRGDADSVAPAKEIDPEYAKAVKSAVKNGVEILAYQTTITPKGIQIKKKIPFYL